MRTLFCSYYIVTENERERGGGATYICFFINYIQLYISKQKEARVFAVRLTQKVADLIFQEPAIFITNLLRILQKIVRQTINESHYCFYKKFRQP